MRLRYWFAACVAFCFSLIARAGLPDIAIVAAAGTPQATDVRNKLLSTGLFNSVTYIDAALTTPTLAQLQSYDAVICWSNQTFQNPALLGDVLADYVDAGGGVVVAVFATSTMTTGRSLAGRFRTGGYEIIPTMSGNTTGTATLGTIVEPTHPAVAGVASFNGGTSSFRPTTTALSSHGFLVAQWSDGKTLIAASNLYPNRIDLGFYPPSRDAVSTSWDPATDGLRMLSNSILAVIPPSPPQCDPDVNCDGSADGFDVEAMEQAVGGDMSNFCQADPDFNHDGSVDGFDIEAVEQVVGGAPCP